MKFLYRTVLFATCVALGVVPVNSAIVNGGESNYWRVTGSSSEISQPSGCPAPGAGNTLSAGTQALSLSEGAHAYAFIRGIQYQLAGTGNATRVFRFSASSLGIPSRQTSDRNNAKDACVLLVDRGLPTSDETHVIQVTAIGGPAVISWLSVEGQILETDDPSAWLPVDHDNGDDNSSNESADSGGQDPKETGAPSQNGAVENDTDDGSSLRAPVVLSAALLAIAFGLLA